MWVATSLLFLTVSVLSGTFAANRCNVHALEEPVAHEHRVLLPAGDAVVNLRLVDCVTAETRGTLCMGPRWQTHTADKQVQVTVVSPLASVSVVVIPLVLLFALLLCMRNPGSRIYVLTVPGGLTTCTRGSQCKLHAARIYAARDHIGLGWWLVPVLHVRSLLRLCCCCFGCYRLPFPFYVLREGQGEVLCTLGPRCPQHGAAITASLNGSWFRHP